MADRIPQRSDQSFELGPNGALRTKIGEKGRIHLDRWLPFLILHRGEGGPASLARRIALNSPAYLVWQEQDDQAALEMLERIVPRLVTESGSLLVIAVDDALHDDVAENSPDLPELLTTIHSATVGGAGRAADSLAKTLSDIEIDLRKSHVRQVPFRPSLPPRFDESLQVIDGVERLVLLLPPIHRAADGSTYPGIANAMTTRVVDALLRASCSFLDDGSGRAPQHYRSLGRSAYLAAALKADRKLSEIQSRFDFLLSISPINQSEARQRFIDDRAQHVPNLRYRPLTVDPDSAKRDLYAIDLAALEDPTLEQLFAEKRRELDAQLTMLATRNTPSFLAASMFLYGAVNDDLLADARVILASSATDPPRGETVGAQEIATAAGQLVAAYRERGEFDATVLVRDDVSGLMVSGASLFVGSDSIMPRHRLRALLAHEVSIHLLTYFNGAAQGLNLFRNGLAGYEGVQEGLGVFAEWATGGLTRTRLRLLAGRVVAVDAMLGGADFIECWRLLHKEHGFTRRGAFGICARVFRSGGLAKDAIYLQGFRAVLDLVMEGAPLDPFWLGKIAVSHVPAIDDLLQRGLVVAPRLKPEFLSDDAASARIARLRQDKNIQDLFEGASETC